MRTLLSAFIFFAPLAHAAPSSGLADTDTLFVGYTDTWSADYPADHDGEIVQVCVVAAEPSHVRATSRSWHITGELSLCESALPGDEVVIAKSFPADQIHDAFFNKSAIKGLPHQRAFEGRVSGKEINDALAAVSAKCQSSTCTYYLKVGRKTEAWGLKLPGNGQGNDFDIDPMGVMNNSAGAFSFSNFYAHHIAK